MKSAALALLLVLAVTACGSKNSTPTTTEAANTPVTWAGDVCSAIGTWKSAVNAAGQTVRANPSKDGVQQGLDDLQAANKAFADSVKGLDAPNLQSVDLAKSTLTSLQTKIDADVQTIQSTLDSMSLSNAAASAQTISTTIKSMSTEFKSAGDSLRSLQGGELSQAFNDAPACQELSG
jgi:hypothetical protein